MSVNVELVERVRRLVAYVDSCDEAKGGGGFVDTGELLWQIEAMRPLVEEEG